MTIDVGTATCKFFMFTNNIVSVRVFCKEKSNISNRRFKKLIDMNNTVFTLCSWVYVNGPFQRTIAKVSKPSGWFHLGVVSRATTVTLYINGRQASGVTYAYNALNNARPQNGQWIVGREFLENNNYYSSLMIDELILWNRPLGDDEMKDIADRDARLDTGQSPTSVSGLIPFTRFM